MKLEVRKKVRLGRNNKKNQEIKKILPLDVVGIGGYCGYGYG